MSAAVFHGPNQISIEQRAFEFKKQQVAVKLNACAICGYDVRVYRRGHRKVNPPVILGHEIAGELLNSLKTPDGNLSAGSRVALCPLIPCLECGYCIDGHYNLCINLKEIGSTWNGGFAEYVQIPEQTAKIGGAVPVPDNLSDEEAALIEPLACCINGFSSLAPISNSRPVVIIGDGPIGLLQLQLFKNLTKARVAVVGKSAYRLKKAENIGADAIFQYGDEIASDMLDFVGSNGAGAVVIATSNPEVFELAKKVSGRASKISMFAGMPAGENFCLDVNWLHYNEISISGAFSSLPIQLKYAANLVRDKIVDLSMIISHKYPLAAIHEALKVTEEYRGLRVIINRF